MMNKRKRVEELGETKHRQVRQRILQEHKNDILENLAFERKFLYLEVVKC